MREKILKAVPLIFLIGALLVIFRTWFLPSTIAGGDLDYLWNYDYFSLHPYAWNIKVGEGLGIFFVPFLWIYMIISIPINFIAYPLNLPWDLAQRLILFYPFLALSVYSSHKLFKKLFPDSKFSYLSSFIFVVNTYTLNIVQGGQLVLAIAYGLVPILFLMAIKVINEKKDNIRFVLLLGLFLALQLMLDIRVFYMVFFLLSLYIFILFVSKKNWLFLIKTFTKILFIPSLIAFFVNLFWILPILAMKIEGVNEAIESFGTQAALNFLSFAQLENTISLLHPNWPENIFGKVYFMKPEFLLIPILAFSGMFFVNNMKNEKLYIVFFSLVALIGGFLAKGVNEPFGILYKLLFDYVPGFVMFRDPTKWYMFVVLSYSILIPLSVDSLYKIIQTKFLKTKVLPAFFLSVVLIYFLFLIHPAIFGQLGGTLRPRSMPKEYIDLKQFISNQKGYYRTLWIPQVQRFGYSSNANPAISARSFFNDSNDTEILSKIKESRVFELIRQAGVKYIVVPSDSEKEIFINDRKYDHSIYLDTISSLKKNSSISFNKQFGDIAVFEIDNFKDHFWSDSNTINISYEYINPTKYEVNVENAKRGERLIFSEGYSLFWQASINGDLINSAPFNTKFNSFILPKDGSYQLIITYKVQDWVDLGYTISLLVVSLIIIIVSYLFVSSFKIRGIKYRK